MRLAPLCCVLLITGCPDRVAPNVEENSNLVRVEPEPKGVLPDPPVVVQPPPVIPVEKQQPPPKVALVLDRSLITEPEGATTLSELREVTVKLDVEGVDPSEVSVEFTTPEGTVFNRQVTRLTQTRYHRQHVEFSMPVAGTVISSAQLVGTWQAHLFLEGVELSSLSFEVKP